MIIEKKTKVEALNKKEFAFLRSMVWKRFGLRLRFVCRERKNCYYCLKRNTAKAFKVNGACNVLAKVTRVSEVIFWGKTYSVKKG